MASKKNPNSIVVSKIAGRYRELPMWATKLAFEVRPSLDFDNRAWKLWKPTLLLMHKVVRKEKIKIQWVRIHSHFNLKRELTHAMGFYDPEEKGVFLCHFDLETMLHELGHAKSSGYHGDPWAKATAKLYLKYLKGRTQTLAMENLGQYLSGRRVYRKLYGERPPTFEYPKGIWLHRKP